MDLIKKEKKNNIVNNQIIKINDTITKIKNQLFSFNNIFI